MEGSHNPYAAAIAPAMPELPPLPDAMPRSKFAGRGERLLAKSVDRLRCIACTPPDALSSFGRDRRCLHDAMADTIVIVA
jgi:hypothetical protein